MKLATAIAVCCVLLWGGATSGEMTRAIPTARLDREAVLAEKLAASGKRPSPSPAAGTIAGDDIESAIEILAFPTVVTGNTCDFNHQYDAVCPFNLPGAPDVVYRYTPANDERVRVLLCTSSYDTKLYVFENVVDNVVSCNDDLCGSDGFKSEINCVPMVAGNTYYFVVDGFSLTDCGEYVLEFTDCAPCPNLICISGSQLEGEVSCADGYVDSYNGGCEADPPAFTEISCTGYASTRFCGTYGGYTNGPDEMRDVDWYFTEVYFDSEVNFCVSGSYTTYFGIVDGRGGCGAPLIYASAVGNACEEACVTAFVPSGRLWFFVTTDGFGPAAGECGGLYRASAEGEGICLEDLPVTPTSWGSVKARYR